MGYPTDEQFEEARRDRRTPAERRVAGTGKPPKVDTFDAYQDFCQTTAIYPNRNAQLDGKPLGHCAVTDQLLHVLMRLGEAAEKMGKIARDTDGVMTTTQRNEIVQKFMDASQLMLRMSHILGRNEPLKMDGLVYTILKSFGEDAEFAHALRSGNEDKENLFGSKDLRDDLVKELGDRLWYLSAQASELGVSLAAVAQVNVNKLHSRQQRNVLGGSGDNR